MHPQGSTRGIKLKQKAATGDRFDLNQASMRRRGLSYAVRESPVAQQDGSIAYLRDSLDWRHRRGVDHGLLVAAGDTAGAPQGHEGDLARHQSDLRHRAGVL